LRISFTSAFHRFLAASQSSSRPPSSSRAVVDASVRVASRAPPHRDVVAGVAIAAIARSTRAVSARARPRNIAVANRSTRSFPPRVALDRARFGRASSAATTRARSLARALDRARRVRVRARACADGAAR
jgi:hypothetical protein